MLQRVFLGSIMLGIRLGDLWKRERSAFSKLFADR